MITTANYMEIQIKLALIEEVFLQHGIECVAWISDITLLSPRGPMLI